MLLRSIPAIVIVSISLSVSGCQQNFDLKKSKNTRHKVVLIGIDGASWKVILPLIWQGKLPHMAKVMREGSWGVLRSEEPMKSPALWTTIATGKSRHKHGIVDLAKKEADNYGYSYYTSQERKTKAFWNILTDYGISSGVVKWWSTWPAERINGYMVSDYFQFESPVFGASGEKGIRDIVYPQSILGTVKKYDNTYKNMFGNTKIIPDGLFYPKESNMSFEEAVSFAWRADDNEIQVPEIRKMILIHKIRNFSKSDARAFLIGIDLLKAFPTDLFTIYFQGVDSVSHSFWEFFEPDANCNPAHSAEEMSLFSEVIQKYYEWQDNMIGRLLENFDKKDTTVIIVSDHGFERFCEPFPYSANLNFLFEKMGLLTSKEGRILFESTVAYQPLAFKTYYQPACLNLKNRDAEGIVRIEDYETLRVKVRERMSALETHSGKKLFDEIVFAENPHKKNIDFGFRLNSLLSTEDKITINGSTFSLKKFLIPQPWSGNHELEGVIIMSGKNIKKGRIIKGAGIADITPTILALYGAPVGKDMEGCVLADVIEEGYLRESPVTFVASHDLPSESPKKTVKDQAMDEGLQEKLKSIGYLQ